MDLIQNGHMMLGSSETYCVDWLDQSLHWGNRFLVEILALDLLGLNPNIWKLK